MWYSSMYAPLRAGLLEIAPFKIGRQQRANSSVTPHRIVRFRSNLARRV